MATKKTTKKKASAKQTELHSSFDLNIDSKEKSLVLVAHLRSLQANSGWMLMVQIMKGNIEVLERAIITKLSVTNEKLTEEELDDMRKLRNVMEEMIEKPEKLINQFTVQTGAVIPSYDPFAKDIDEHSRHFRDEQYASSLKTE